MAAKKMNSHIQVVAFHLYLGRDMPYTDCLPKLFLLSFRWWLIDIVGMGRCRVRWTADDLTMAPLGWPWLAEEAGV